MQHGDGTSAPWHPGLAPRALGLERRMHRNACYVLVVGLSMMRDSEKRAELRLMQHSATKTMAGAPEDALDTACGLYLGNPTAWA